MSDFKAAVKTQMIKELVESGMITIEEGRALLENREDINWLKFVKECEKTVNE